MLRLKPSEIMFSQATINNVFDRKSRHRHNLVGETLDDICEGRCLINNLPTISVMKRDGKWVTSDNRRLWVFRELERLGKCDSITVNETRHIDSRKLNSSNGGVSVGFHRGRSPGGRWHKFPTKVSFIIKDVAPVVSRSFTADTIFLDNIAKEGRAEEPKTSVSNKETEIVLTSYSCNLETNIENTYKPEEPNIPAIRIGSKTEENELHIQDTLLIDHTENVNNTGQAEDAIARHKAINDDNVDNDAVKCQPELRRSNRKRRLPSYLNAYICI